MSPLHSIPIPCIYNNPGLPGKGCLCCPVSLALLHPWSLIGFFHAWHVVVKDGGLGYQPTNLFSVFNSPVNGVWLEYTSNVGCGVGITTIWLHSCTHGALTLPHSGHFQPSFICQNPFAPYLMQPFVNGVSWLACHGMRRRNNWRPSFIPSWLDNHAARCGLYGMVWFWI